MKLHQLEKPKGSTKARKRLGRGPGSGTGKTCGHGQKGQKSRSGGKVRRGFEGGQTPLHRRLPKFGFTNPSRVTYDVINLDRLDELQGVSEGEVITKETLKQCGVIANTKVLVKLLGRGEISKKFQIEVDKASQSAVQKMEAAGGKVLIVGEQEA